MKSRFFVIGLFLTHLSFASQDPQVIATYTDFYNDDDLIAECLIFSDSTGMKMFDNIVPYYKPESFKVKPTHFKKLNTFLQSEAKGKIDIKTKKCNESVSPYGILGAINDEIIDVPYITGEARKEFSSEEPYCWLRLKRDHISLSEASNTAKLLKDICGFVGQ